MRDALLSGLCFGFGVISSSQSTASLSQRHFHELEHTILLVCVATLLLLMLPVHVVRMTVSRAFSLAMTLASSERCIVIVLSVTLGIECGIPVIFAFGLTAVNGIGDESALALSGH